MSKIKVDIDVLVKGHFTTMFHDIILEVEETSNKKMNQAFEDQHPGLLSQIPKIKPTYICAFECVNVREVK